MEEQAGVRWQKVERLLDEAMEIPADALPAFLDRRCGSDARLRAEVESLLDAMERPDGFLDRGAFAPDAPARDPGHAATGAGSLVGPWRLLHRLGRGGMGEVFEAERADGQFVQRVAVKMIRSDIAVSAARFLVERQIIAALQHPGIVRLLDGGMTADGRPYTVMELVEGESLRQYCASRTLDLDGRLDLFRQIVDAVAYAHRHLVVHRDLKPGNVRVDADGRAKLLDFGIAKILAPNAGGSERTQMLFTPDAAAPELLTGAAVTAAVDVYGLGLILHELLTGHAPYDLGGKPLAVAIREILERELPPPAATARLDIPSAMRTDIDAIALKAVRHDPLQRYPTAAALLEDFDRWRASEPVHARGDGGWYLASRFVRRHRLAFVAGVAVILSLAAGIAGIAWQAREAAVQRDEAQAQAARMKAVNDYILYMFRVADEEKSSGETVSARTVLEKGASRVREAFANDPAGARTMLLSLGELYFQIGDPHGAEALFREFLTLADAGTDPDTLASAKQRLAEITFTAANPGPALTLLSEAQAIWTQDLDRFHQSYDGSRIVEAAFEREIGHPDRGARILESVAAGRGADADPEFRAVVLNELGSAYSEEGRFDEAMATYRRSLQLFDSTAQGESSNAAIALNNLCGTTLLAGRTREAETCARHSLALLEKLYGESINSAAAELLLGQVQLALGDANAALVTLQHGSTTGLKFAGSGSALVHRLQLSIARALCDLGRLADAETLLASIDASVRGSDSLGPHFQGLVLTEKARIALHRGDRAGALAMLDRASPLVNVPHGNLRDDQAVVASLRAQLGAGAPPVAGEH